MRALGGDDVFFAVGDGFDGDLELLVEGHQLVIVGRDTGNELSLDVTTEGIALQEGGELGATGASEACPRCLLLPCAVEIDLVVTRGSPAGRFLHEAAALAGEIGEEGFAALPEYWLQLRGCGRRRFSDRGYSRCPLRCRCWRMVSVKSWRQGRVAMFVVSVRAESRYRESGAALAGRV